MNKKKCLIYLGKSFHKTFHIIDLEVPNNSNPTLTELFNHFNLDLKNISLSEQILDFMSNGIFIARLKSEEYIVIKNIPPKNFIVFDPCIGEYKSTIETIKSILFASKNQVSLYIVEPTTAFYQNEIKKEKNLSILSLISYLTRYKKYFFQISLGLFASSVILLIIPFLTKAIIDKGILNEDMDFVYIAVIAQFLLYIASLTIDFFRRWFFLHIGNRINIRLVNEFLNKIFRLPMTFFENSNVSTLLKRIDDHSKLHTLLAVSSLKTILSLLTITLLTSVLFIVHPGIFLVFTIGSVMSMLWVYAFLKRRGKIDNKRFEVTSKEQNKTIEIFEKIQDIKIYNTEGKNRAEWLKYRTRLFKIENQWLTLDQVQELGADALDKIKGLLIILISAKAVISGVMTLGELFAINMVVSQLEKPMKQVISFVVDYFDASVAFKRISKIKELEDECPENEFFLNEIPPYDKIIFENIEFHYPENSKIKVLNGVNLTIPKGKTTAIIGTSGSGKSTLLKILMRYYQPTGGEIKIGGVNLTSIHASAWRNKMGVVLQEGKVFNDSILENIAMDKEIDYEEIIKISKLVCLHDFVIEALPYGYHTVLGEKYGIHLSKGQEQRLLFARALYGNPDFLFLDEATSALDNNTEKQIINNLKNLDEEKTIVVIAHRLSTVKDADNIIVIDKGQIIEQGNHFELLEKEGMYYELLKDQLVLTAEYE